MLNEEDKGIVETAKVLVESGKTLRPEERGRLRAFKTRAERTEQQTIDAILERDKSNTRGDAA